MRRSPRKRWAPDMSLFPFLSVLLCTLGALVFIAVGVTPSSLISAARSVHLQIQGVGSEEKLEPIFVECTADCAASMDGRHVFTGQAQELASERSWEHTDFGRFLTALNDSTGGGYVVFLVRPDGLETFRALQRMVRLHNQERSYCSMEFSDAPDSTAWRGLPEALKARLRRDGDNLGVFGPMTEKERGELKAAFEGASALAAIDELYTRSQLMHPSIEHGSELVPAEWQIKEVSISGDSASHVE